MRSELRRDLLEMSKPYLPLLAKIERSVIRQTERDVATIMRMRRIQQQRLEDEAFREAAHRQRLKQYLLLNQPEPRIGVVGLWRQRWSEFRILDYSAGDAASALPVAVDDTIDWISQTEQAGEQALDEEEKAELIAKRVAASAGTTKPDPFVVSAPTYKQGSNVRLVCRKCDATLSRGVRGVHLFSWNDNYHLAINEELFDTLSYKEVTDASELRRSPWKRAKATCPCCGTSVGSLGVANGRMKVLFKGVHTAWRKSDVSHVQSKTNHNWHKNTYQTRPVGAGLSASWLHAHAGLMTHNRRWVLDSTVVHKLVSSTGENAKGSSGDSQDPDLSSAGDNLVRINTKDSQAMSESLKLIGHRTAAYENLVLLEALSKGFADAVSSYESAFARESELNVKLDDPYDSSPNMSRMFFRFVLLSKLAQVLNDSDRMTAVKALLKTPRFQDITKSVNLAIKSGHPAVDFIPARMLTSAARVLYHHPDSVRAAAKALARRKEKFGPAAGAFGRSAEYLRDALKRCGETDKVIDDLLAKAGSLHPTPGGRFGVELEPSGFVELFCTHGDGLECNRRATHAPPPTTGLPGGGSGRDGGGSFKGIIPVYCRSHAPLGYVATSEGYRGVLPPMDDRRHGGSGHRGDFGHHHHSHQPWHNRRRNLMVDVPDPSSTEYGEPEPGTLYLGKEWESKVQAVYSPEDLKQATTALEQLIAKAEEFMQAHPQKLPSADTAVGIDVEWKPEFVFDESNRVASTIQVATREQTFVFDAIALGAQLHPIMKQLLKSKAIMKVGHGLAEDFARISQALTKAAGNADEAPQSYFPIESVLELGELFCKAESRVYTNGARPSLVTMVDAATGARLDKRCQMTDWERRPLSPAQVRYAATDAACGLLMFDIFAKKIAQSLNVQAIDIGEYLQRDDGSTKPQRANQAVAAQVVTQEGVQGRTHAESSAKPQDDFYRSEVVFPSGPQYQTPVYHQPLRYGGGYLRGNQRQFHAPLPRFQNKGRFMNKYETRRLRELKFKLIAQGVRVDEHAKLEGLEVASGHLQRSLDKVVRRSLIDPPVDPVPATPPRPQ